MTILQLKSYDLFGGIKIMSPLNISSIKSYKFIFTLLLTLLPTLTLQANCTFKTSEYLEQMSNPKSVKNIEIIVNKHRKWVKNYFKALTHRKHKSINAKYKKKFKAKVIVHYGFGKCNYKAKVRISGDELDHLGGRNQAPSLSFASSLDIALQEGNILNKVKFKLLLPKTRNGVNEIFYTQILRELNFIAPLTFLVNVTQNNKNLNMLFQEKAAKELLESSNRRESVIFEGDESYLVGYKDYKWFALELKSISLSKVVNGKWASKGKVSWEITKDAYLRLQEAYINARISHTWQTLDYDTLSADEILKNKWKTFDILAIGTRATHGHNLHNRKFYHNDILRSFEPIYYDGDVNPRREQVAFLTNESKSHLLSNITLKDLDETIKALKDINTKAFDKRLLNLNVNINSKLNSEIFINQMINNINTLKNDLKSFNLKDTFKYKTNNYDIYTKRLFNQRTKFYTANIIDINNDDITLNICHKDDCTKKIYNYLDIVDLFEKNGEILPLEYVLLPNKDEVNKYGSLDNQHNQNNNIQTKRLDNFTITYTKSANININETKKLITLISNNNNDWFLFKNGNIDDYEIRWQNNANKNIDKAKQSISQEAINTKSNKQSENNYVNSTSNTTIKANPSQQRFNKYGLTGCVSFYKVSFNNTKLYANNSHCEDAINIINSTGNINEINIHNALYDALDIDFSNININNITIKNALNDCIDVSSGTYNINNANLNSCKDKGISAGEKSYVSVKSAFVDNAHIGIASKDSSITTINKLDTTNTKYCAQAYKKKQEYDGAILHIKQSKQHCISDIYSDEHSQAYVGG